MSSEAYNGWPNRETWAAHLWITATEELYEGLMVDINDAVAHSRDKPAAASSVIKHYLEEITYLVLAGEGGLPDWMGRMVGDIGSLWRVDYRTVAENLLEEIGE